MGQHRLEQCTKWLECTKEGQYELTKPTSSTDRKCGRKGVCTEDEFESQAATATSDRTCQELSRFTIPHTPLPTNLVMSMHTHLPLKGSEAITPQC